MRTRGARSMHYTRHPPKEMTDAERMKPRGGSRPWRDVDRWRKIDPRISQFGAKQRWMPTMRAIRNIHAFLTNALVRRLLGEPCLERIAHS
jgi:hypothetical protein